MIRALAVLMLLTGPAQAEGTAREAVDLLGRAAERLGAASGASDRIAALTGAVRAYEAGLAALREGMREIAIREAALAGDLSRHDARMSRLIGVLSGIERTPAPLLMLHPDGPLGTARAAMLLGAATPALEAQAAGLRADLGALRDLRQAEAEATAGLERGLAGIQSAREALSMAISERADLPPAPDARLLDTLLARAGTLTDFAEGLASLPGPPVTEAAPGPMPLPVDATVLRGFREPDAAGIERPGLVLATASSALLTAPAQASVRYAGPLLDYGLVIVLEPGPGALMVFAGLAEAYVRRGDVLAPGAPMGMMGGNVPDAMDFLAGAEGGGGAIRPETLYVETRQGGTPVDPGTWFDLSGTGPPANE